MKVRLCLLISGLIMLPNILPGSAGPGRGPDEKVPPQEVLPRPRSEFQYQGAGSCAAASCHNSNAPRGIPGGEFTVWVTQDSHSRAYRVLFEDRSRIIEKNLNGFPRLEDAHPEKNVLCLNCHVHPGFKQSSHAVAYFKVDGVSCESCHGPAEKWLTVHFQDSWKGKTPDEKAALGMRDTKTILGRARTCVDCHVGYPGNDVNHDLIAAGHPELKFEFGGYHARMARHWGDAKDKKPEQGGTPDFEARAWLAGQVVSTRGAMALLEHRARQARKKSPAQPWPEFAEYNCAACHHDLQAPSWRQKPGRKIGQMPWQTWYTLLLPVALESEENKTALKPILARIKEGMEGRTRPTLVAENARKAVEILDGSLRHLEKKMDKNLLPVKDLFRSLAGKNPRDVEEAMQVYLALGAMHNAWKDMPMAPPPKSMRGILENWGNRLGESRWRDSGPGAFQKDLQRLLALFD